MLQYTQVVKKLSQISKVSSQSFAKQLFGSTKKRIGQKWVVLAGLAMLLAVAAFLASQYSSSVKDIPVSATPSTAVADCRELLKKDSSIFEGVDSAHCTFEPMAIANPSLTARYYTYSANCSFKYPYGTTDFNSACPQGSGVLLSNGEQHKELSNQAQMPDEYDHCYSTRGGIDKPTPTTRDLYFYNGELYNRDIFVSAEATTPFGTCTLNGTTLSRSFEKIITNVAVDYKSFPKACPDAIDYEKDYKNLNGPICIEFSSAAYKNIETCFLDQKALDQYLRLSKATTIVSPEVTTRYSSLCLDAYVQRMAALKLCGSVIDTHLRESCEVLVDKPAYNTTRVFTSL